jgi:hypothetical protein
LEIIKTPDIAYGILRINSQSLTSREISLKDKSTYELRVKFTNYLN